MADEKVIVNTAGLVEANASTEMAPPKKRRGPRQKSGGGDGSVVPGTASPTIKGQMKRVEKPIAQKAKGVGKLEAKGTAARASTRKLEMSVPLHDDIADLIQLEEENARLRKALSDKLRAENANLRKRLGLA